MPVALDTYNQCSYDCLYCFSYFQRAQLSEAYMRRQLGAIRPERLIRLFEHPEQNRMFGPLISRRMAVQWGALSDQFDNHERKVRAGLPLMRYLREIEYPVSFSTKGTWWLDDPEYREVFRGARNFHVKVSIITLDRRAAAAVERGAPSPEERLLAMSKLRELGVGGVTLRFRPFIIGMSNPRHCELVERAGNAGADSVSTEFMCLEQRATPRLKHRYALISKALGFDVLQYYRGLTRGSGYLRLNRAAKAGFLREMKQAAHGKGMRFFVSDAHWKEESDGGSCCGLPENWNYSRGQFTEAAVTARMNGSVRFGTIARHLDYAKGLMIGRDCATTSMGFGPAGGGEALRGMTLYDYFRYVWNRPMDAQSPYRYFGGALVPAEQLDENGDVVYLYSGKGLGVAGVAGGREKA